MFLSEIFRILQRSSLRLVYYTEGKDLKYLKSWLKVRVCMRTDQVRLSSVNRSAAEVKGAYSDALTDPSFLPSSLHVSYFTSCFYRSSFLSSFSAFKVSFLPSLHISFSSCSPFRLFPSFLPYFHTTSFFILYFLPGFFLFFLLLMHVVHFLFLASIHVS